MSAHYLKEELYQRVRDDDAVFEFLQAGSLDGVWYWDLEKPDHEWMSERFWEVFGYDPAEKKHLAAEWQDMIDPDDLQVAFENFERHCADPTHPYDQVVRYRSKDGTTVWVRCRGLAIRDEAGEPIRMLGAHTDITELMQIRQELQVTNKELGKQVLESQEANRELESLNQELSTVNRHKTKFLSTMSHELRTPLNAIIGFSDLLKGKHFGPLNEKQADYVSRITSSGKHLLSLINDLLDLAKIDAGSADFNPESVDSRELFDSVIQLFESQANAKSLRMNTEVAADVTAIHADARKFKQILLNLVSNAIKYTPDKGHVTITADHVRDGVRVEVRDNGIGIEPELREQVFEEFKQADPKRDEQIGGIGIGLALTRRLIELHGGTIGVDSELGVGSTFWFVLPQPEKLSKPTPVKATPTPAQNSDRTTKQVLVAEDNDANLALIVDMLSVRDYEVIVARNGREAVDLAVAHKPDLILMDMRMPIMDGYEATRKLRAMPETQEIAIVALSASVETDSQERQIAAGCNAHLSKPVDMKALMEVLDEFLGD